MYAVPFMDFVHNVTGARLQRHTHTHTHLRLSRSNHVKARLKLALITSGLIKGMEDERRVI